MSDYGGGDDEPYSPLFTLCILIYQFWRPLRSRSIRIRRRRTRATTARRQGRRPRRPRPTHFRRQPSPTNKRHQNTGK